MQTGLIYVKLMHRKRIVVFVAWSLTLGVWFSPGTLPMLAQVPSSLAKEMLQPTYLEEFSFNAPPKDVWQAISDEVKLISHSRVLVSEADDLVLSWVELPDPTTPVSKSKPQPAAIPENNWHGREITPVSYSPKPALSTNDLTRLKEAEVAEVGEDRVAVTTVMVMAAPKGAIARFRRIYYGSHTQPRIAHSTGAYESWFVSQLSRRLASQTGVK